MDKSIVSPFFDSQCRAVPTSSLVSDDLPTIIN